MHALYTILVALCNANTRCLDELTAADHGKVVLFSRHRKLGPFRFPYYHKGIIFYPSACGSADLAGLEAEAELEVPHVIHLHGESKRYAKVRIDPFKDVLGKDSFEIVSESGSCYAGDVCVKRALQEVGKDHRGVSYNLIANNCGNFVAWAKHGSSDADTQVRDYIARLKLLKYPLYALQNRVRDSVKRRAKSLLLDDFN